MTKRFLVAVAFAIAARCAIVAGASASAFSNTVLRGTWSPPPGLTESPVANSSGDSEPAIAFGSGGAMAVDGLGWLPFQVNLWKGTFGSTPSYFGAMDTNLSINGLLTRAPHSPGAMATSLRWAGRTSGASSGWPRWSSRRTCAP